jgi:hypothetical protein
MTCVLNVQMGAQPNVPRSGDGNAPLHLLLIRLARLSALASAPGGPAVAGVPAADMAAFKATMVAAITLLVSHGARLNIVNAAGKSAEALASAAGVKSLPEAAAAFASKQWPPAFIPPPGKPPLLSPTAPSLCITCLTCKCVVLGQAGGLVQASTCRASLHQKLGMLANKDTWIDDDASANCQLCASKFGMLVNRKHHVRIACRSTRANPRQ